MKRLFQWWSEEAQVTASVMVRRLGRPGDLGWMLMAHGEVYAEEFGWNTEFETEVARIVADYAESRDSGRQAAWIAEVDGARAGCVAVVPEPDSADTARLRILLVHPSARGHGLGRRLVDACVAFAREAGYRKMVLWTNDPLVAARHVYLSAGFHLVDEEKRHIFGADMVSQTYELDLAGGARIAAEPAPGRP